jgi:hypothetical protein
LTNLARVIELLDEDPARLDKRGEYERLSKLDAGLNHLIGQDEAVDTVCAGLNAEGRSVRKKLADQLQL